MSEVMKQTVSNSVVLEFCDETFPHKVVLSSREKLVEAEAWLIEKLGPDALTDAEHRNEIVWIFNPSGRWSFCYRPDMSVNVYFLEERDAMLFAMIWKR